VQKSSNAVQLPRLSLVIELIKFGYRKLWQGYACTHA